MSVKFTLEAESVEEAREFLAAVTGIRTFKGGLGSVEISHGVEDPVIEGPTLRDEPVTAADFPSDDVLEVHTDENETDADGIVWDSRIHSSNKKKVKSGHWQRRRGIEDDQFNAIVHSLQLHAGVVTPEPEEAPVTVSTISTFPELVAAITGGGVSPDIVTAVLKSHDVSALPLLATKPELIPAIAAELGL